MANTKISALTALTGANVAANDALPIVDTNVTTTKKIDASELKTYMSDSPTLVTPNIGVATGTSLDVSGVLESGANAGTGGQLKMFGATSGDATLKVAAAAGTATVFQLPATNGTSTYALTTNGSGVTSWNQIGLTTAVTGILPVANGGTGLSSGTSGGVPYFSATGTINSSTALAANALVIGGGAGAAPSTTTTGTGILTFLGTPSSANLAAAITDETGTGSLVFSNTPTFTTPVLGAATGTSLSLSGTNQVTVYDNSAGVYSRWRYNGGNAGILGTGSQVISGGGNTDFGLGTEVASALILFTNNARALTLSSTGAATFGNLYGVTVTTPRNVFVDSSGNIGGISSTRASKTNINDIADISWIFDLSPKTFNYRKKDDQGNYTEEFDSELMYGLIAEDVETVNPHLCAYNTINDQSTLVGINYDRLIAPLITAVKKLKTDLEAAKKRIEVLETPVGNKL